MKYSFYCLPLKKNVKAKVTAVVKKKSYGIKGEYKYKGKSYNCHKVCSKAEAERVSRESGLDIQYPGIEDKASESVTEVVDAPVAEETPEGVEEVAMLGDDTFQPAGDGRVIGSNAASMVTATDGTNAVVNINATPFRSEDEDKIGPMSMAAESDGCCCGATKENPCKCMGLDDQQPCSSNKPMCPCYAAKSDDPTCASCGEAVKEDDIIGDGTNRGLCCVPDYYDEDDDSHLGADEEVIEINVDLEDPEYDDADWETFELSKELYHALTAHTDWDDMTREGSVKVFRDNDIVHVSAAGPFADDLLDMIIECHEFPMLEDDTYIDDRFLFDSENDTPSKLRKNALLFTGFGALGLISAILLYQRFNKEE